LKEQGNQKLQRVLIPDPELSSFYPTQKEDFLIIATDGLWDVMTSQAAVDHTRALLTQEGLLGEMGCFLLFIFLLWQKLQWRSHIFKYLSSSNLYISHICTGNGDISALGEDIINMRLSQVANNIAVHSVSNLGSMDNVTVLIILLNNAPAYCPVKLPSPTKYHTRTFNAVERAGMSGENKSARWGADSDSKSDYSSGTRGTTTQSSKEVELDTYLDDEGHHPGICFYFPF